MPELDLTREGLAAAAVDLIPEDRDRHKARFGPLVLVALSALIGEVMVRLVDECWDHLKPRTIRGPWFLARRRLREIVAECAGREYVRSAATGAGLGPGEIDAVLGDDCHKAVLEVGKRLTDDQIARIRVTRLRAA